MARAALWSLSLLATHAVTSGSLLDDFEWLKQHGDEAMEVAGHCQDVITQLSKLTEHCRMTKMLENFAAKVAWATWVAIEQTGKDGSNSFFDLANSPPALAMKEKAQKAFLATTPGSMDEACNPECNLQNHHEFFEAFAGCYAPSVCAASPLGKGDFFHRCSSSFQTFIMKNLKFEARHYCQKDEQGVYCQQHEAELRIRSPLCYSFYTKPVPVDLPSMAMICAHKECVEGWKQAEEHPTCSDLLIAITRSRSKNRKQMEREIWQVPFPNISLSYYDACIHPAKPGLIV